LHYCTTGKGLQRCSRPWHGRIGIPGQLAKLPVRGSILIAGQKNVVSIGWKAGSPMERILTAYSAVTAHPSSNRAVTRQVLILLLRIMGTMKKFIGPVSCSAILLALFLMMNVQNAMAVRPFVTDHARVVGYHVLQLERPRSISPAASSDDAEGYVCDAEPGKRENSHARLDGRTDAGIDARGDGPAHASHDCGRGTLMAQPMIAFLTNRN
jgi:hypothetical protein